MFEFALKNGVPLIPRTAWVTMQKQDFDIDSGVQDCYNHYMKTLGAMSSLGTLFNAHMAVYFAWRFRTIRCRSEGDMSEFNRIKQSRAAFRIDIRQQDAEVARLRKEDEAALVTREQLQIKRNNLVGRGYVDPAKSDTIKKLEGALRDAENAQEVSRDRYLQAKAKRDAIPDMNDFGAKLAMYDRQLLSDVQEIRKAITSAQHAKSGVQSKRAELRPHYRALVDAYENEIIHKKGLMDTKVIEFFDKYVHDSLPGFVKMRRSPQIHGLSMLATMRN
jgi:hypothetical protein